MIRMVGSYFVRIFVSVPIIGAGILDVALLILNALGIDIQMPVWGYGVVLGFGFLVENIRIYTELQNTKSYSEIMVGIFRDNHVEWGDAITVKYSGNPDFRPSFGLVISTSNPGAIIKGVVADFTFCWRGGMPGKSLSIIPPKDDGRWNVIYDHITNKRPATFKYNGSQEVVAHNQPLYLSNLAFHVVEYLEGYILVQYKITSIDPVSSKIGELVINLSNTIAG